MQIYVCVCVAYVFTKCTRNEICAHTAQHFKQIRTHTNACIPLIEWLVQNLRWLLVNFYAMLINFLSAQTICFHFHFHCCCFACKFYCYCTRNVENVSVCERAKKRKGAKQPEQHQKVMRVREWVEIHLPKHTLCLAYLLHTHTQRVEDSADTANERQRRKEGAREKKEEKKRRRKDETERLKARGFKIKQIINCKGK